MSIRPVMPSQALSLGSRGPEVMRLQRLLNWFPGSARQPLATDGHFGPRTHERVVEFQRSAALTVDGIAGAATLGALAVSPGDIAALGASLRHELLELGVPLARIALFDRKLDSYADLFVQERGAAIAIPIALALLLVFAAAMHMLTPAGRQFSQEWGRYLDRKINELRQALDLPSPGHAMQEIARGIQETVRELVQRLSAERQKCRPDPLKITQCAKQSMQVAVATQSLLQKLELLAERSNWNNGFRMQALVQGIVVACGALVAAYSALGECLGCDPIKLL